MYLPSKLGPVSIRRWTLTCLVLVAGFTPATLPSQSTPTRTASPVRQLALTPRVRIPETSVGGKSIAGFTVSPDGLIVINDGDSHLVVFSAAGTPLYTIGRSGEGPGEFRHIEQLGWLHDTLMVFDSFLKRMSMFQAQAGRLVGSFKWALGDPIWALINSGTSLYAIVPSRTSQKRSRPLQPGIALPVLEYSVFPITGSGAGSAIPQLHDSLDQQPSFDCEKPDGSIEIASFFPDHGEMRTILPGPRLVTANRDDFLLTVRDAKPNVFSTTLHILRPLLTMPDALWDSLTRPYRNRIGSLTCGKTELRPSHLPTVRALQADERARLWVEVTEVAGTSIDILTSAGQSLGTFRMPLHDEEVRWVGRGGMLYLRGSDADGNQSLQVYQVNF